MHGHKLVIKEDALPHFPALAILAERGLLAGDTWNSKREQVNLKATIFFPSDAFVAFARSTLRPQLRCPCRIKKVDAAGKTFSAQRARAIVAEGESWEEANARELAALKEMEDNLLTEA